MNDESDYISTPRLRVLAEELRILNEILIKKNLPDRIRLFQLRDFAQASKNISGVTFPKLEITEDALYGCRYSIQFAPKQLGTFETPSQAVNAYKKAHIEHFGIKSEYHPKHIIDDSHLYVDDYLPTGVRISMGGRYQAIICIKGRAKKIGTFNTVSEASEAFLKASDEAQHKPKAARLITEKLPTGVRRATTASGRFYAQIGARTKERTFQKHLGSFATADEAHNAYKRAHVELYGTESRYYLKEAA